MAKRTDFSASSNCSNAIYVLTSSINFPGSSSKDVLSSSSLDNVSLSWVSCGAAGAIIVSSSLEIIFSGPCVAAASSIKPETSFSISASSASSIGSISTVSTDSFLNLSIMSRSNNTARIARPILLKSILLTFSIIEPNGPRASWTNAASRSTDFV